MSAGGQATPMTYRLSKTGKQYIVLAAGGHVRSGSKFLAPLLFNRFPLKKSITKSAAATSRSF